jgi:hypothetical protein
LASAPAMVRSVLVALARALVVGLAALVATEVLGLAGKGAGVGAGVAVRGVLDQFLLGLLEALGLASTGLGYGALLLTAALLQREMIFFFQHTLLEVVGPARRLYLAA